MADQSSSKKLPFYLDRRNHVRRTVIESRLISVELGETSRGVLIDVGAGGVAVQPFVPLPVGAESDIYFETPTGTRVKAHGMVAWVGENGRTGIRFTEVEPQGLEEIRRWTDSADEEDESSAEASLASSYPELPSLATHKHSSAEPHREVELTMQRSALETAVQRALAMTDADGAAIAMWEAGEVRCTASAGRAPTVGVTVLPGQGMAGQCLLAARPMLCCNARNDARVTQDAAVVWGMGSCAMVPVMKGDAATGVIAVFSTKPVAFDETHLAALEGLATELA
jgi:hypothetical protein